MLKERVRNAGVLAICCAVLLLIGGDVFAQGRRHGPPRHGDEDRPPRQDKDRQGRGGPGRRGGFPGGGDFQFLSSEMRSDGKVVKDIPYSARAVMKNVQTLADGTRVNRESEAAVYRDKAGRTRREITLTGIGPFAFSGEPMKVIFINDPVEGVSFSLDPNRRVARWRRFSEDDSTRDRLEGADFREKTVSLGKQTIDGMEAEGTRSTITIPVGQIGNDRPIEIISEKWYSPSLQAIVMSRHNDPRAGEYTYKLKDITLREPDPKLFEVPSGYEIKKEHKEGPSKWTRPMP